LQRVDPGLALLDVAFQRLGLGQLDLFVLHHGVVFRIQVGQLGFQLRAFGGILRDIMANEVPLIFRRDIYATASFSGAVSVWLGHQFWPGSSWVWLTGFLLVCMIRAAAIHWRLSLPGFLSTVAYRKDNHPREP
jgi:uncharacterized membrane protein YeiH